MTTLIHILDIALKLMSGLLLLLVVTGAVVALIVAGVIWLYGYLTGPGARIFALMSPPKGAQSDHR